MEVSCETLRALATGVSLDADLTVRDGEPGAGWAIDTERRCIYVDPDDRIGLPRDEVLGLTLHEAAHAAVTRYPWLVPPELLDEPGVPMLLNALEDCRIEAWMMARLPGTIPWIAAYNQRLFPAEGGTIGTLEPFAQFCLALVHQWWHRSLPGELHPKTITALRTTAEARRDVVALLPPIQAADTPDPSYQGSRVQRVFHGLDRLPPDGFEQRIRTTAARAWARIWADILPVYRELLRLTPSQTVSALERQNLQRNTARRLSKRPGRRGEDRSNKPSTNRRIQRILPPSPHDEWDAVRRDVLPLVNPLVNGLEALLRPRETSRWRRGYTRGQRVDLRAAMQHQARPERLDLWQQKSLPDRPDPSFGIALDLSGSMAGEGIDWGIRGLVLVSEALQQLQLPFQIWGFQNVLLSFKELHEPLHIARPRLMTMPLEVLGRCPHGNNQPEHNWDGPILTELIATVRERSRTPILLVISDGAPSGPTHAARALQEAIASSPKHLHLIGIGLGPNATHVAEYYPNAAICSLADFPAAIARCLQESLHAP